MSLIDSDGNLDFDKVRYYLNDQHKKLTNKDLDQFKRWERLHELYREHRLRDKATKEYVKEFDISTRTAYRDWIYMVTVFSEMQHFDKQYERAWLVEDARKMLIIARENQDATGYGSIYDKICKTLRLYNNDIEAPPDFKSRPPAKVVMSFDNELAPHPITPEIAKEIEELKKLEGIITLKKSHDK